MRIAVISDTHRRLKYIEASKKLFEDCDVLIHLGDNTDDIEELTRNFTGKVYGVRGNCDFNIEYPKERLLDFEGIKIYFTHGDLYQVKYSLTNIFYKGKEVGADIVLFGHSHVHGIEKYDDIILMNPGSVSLPRSNGRFVGIIDVKNGDIKDIYLRKLEL